MPIQYINVGVNPNDGTGDDLRSAFLKVNDNFQLLASIGGETNYGENVGGGSGQVYSTKVNEALQFRTLAAGTGITINQSSNVITIGNSFTAPASFTTLTVNDGGNISHYEAPGPGAEFKLKGTGAIQTTLNGNTVTINGVFQVADDLAPQLGGSLTLNGKNIVGTGNINIVGGATLDNLTVGRSSGPGDYPGVTILNGTLVVNASSTLKAVTATTLNASASITSPSITATTSGFTGNLTGNTTGTHYGDVAIKGVGGPDIVVIDTADAPATITGSVFGTFSGGITGQVLTPGIDLNSQEIYGIGKINIDGTYTADSNPMTINSYYYSSPIAEYYKPTIAYGGAVPIFTMQQQSFGNSEAIKIRAVSKNSTQLYPLGSSIAFETVNVIDSQDVSIENYDSITIASFNSTTGTGPYYVAFNIPTQITKPSNQTEWTVAGNSNSNYNGTFKCAGATTSTISLVYPSDPGVYGLGTTTITPAQQDEYIHHGWLSVRTYLERQNQEHSYKDYSAFVARVRARNTGEIGAGTGENIADVFRDIIVARGDERVSISRLDIKYATIKPTYLSTLDITTPLIPEKHIWGPVNYDLIIGNDRDGKYINFYGEYDPVQLTGENPQGTAVGGYSFPKAIGSPGQVLTVPAPGSNLLEWATPSGGGGGGGGATYFNNLLDVPQTYLSSDAGKIVRVNSTYDGLEFSSSISATVTGSLIGNASTATALQTTRTINGKNFNGTQNVTLTTSDIAEGTNQYYTDTKVRSAITVTASKALTFNSGTGVFDLAEATANTANTLVKRDSSGNTTLGTLIVSTLQKNTGDTYISISSPVNLSAAITSNSGISTSGTVSAGFISLTGTGDQTLTSTAKIILNPTTSVDLSGKKIVNLSTVAPTADGDAASKKYVDDRDNYVYNASFQTLPISGDTGGTLSVARNATLTFAGSTNISTSTTSTGIQVNLKSSISGVSISGNLPVGGTMSATIAKGGNVTISGNEVTQTSSGSDLNLIPGAGANVVVSSGGLKITDNIFSITGYDVKEFAANTVEQTLSLQYNCTFIRTLNWVDDAAGLAYAYLPPGTNGQIKMIVISDRGTYGNALDTRPRYLVLRGNINGASRSINIGASDANGSSTFIFLNNYWWRIANVA